MPTLRAATKNIVIEQGSLFAWPLRLFITDVDGNRELQDTTGYTSEFTIRDGSDFSGDVVFEAFDTDYITVGWSPAVAERNTPYSLGQWVVPDSGLNGFIYECTTAGTTHASDEPVWPVLIGDDISDGTAEWTCISSDVYVSSIYLYIPSGVTEGLTDWGAGCYTWKLADTFGNAQRLFQGTARLSREATY
jgi:hypothetical protein